MKSLSLSLVARTVACALFLLSLAAVTARAETVETLEETFQASPGGRLVVDVRRGRIDVQGQPGATASVHVERKVSFSSKEREEEFLAQTPVTIEQEGNTIIVRQKDKEPSSWRDWFGHRKRKIDVAYKIVVPTEFAVDLGTAGGRIEVRDINGEVRADTSGGSIKCANINGNVHADTSGGSITLIGCHGEQRADTSGGSIRVENGSGPLNADTSGGSIRVTDYRGDVKADTSGGSIRLAGIQGNVKANTSGGGITADLLSKPTADCRLSTSGGGITVNLPRDSSIELDAATSGGAVHSEFEVPGHDPKKKSTVRGEINGGGPLLHLRTSGGSIRLKAAG